MKCNSTLNYDNMSKKELFLNFFVHLAFAHHSNRIEHTYTKTFHGGNTGVVYIPILLWKK